MTEEINKSYRIAMDEFAKACQDSIGIKPIDDDKLILKAACDFGAYIKTFKRLDHTVQWHRQFMDTMVKVKVDALSKRINQEYGTHKEYLNRLHKKSGEIKATN